MRGWFQRFNNTVQHFMYGRYGIDEFSKFLLMTGMALAVLSLFRPLIWMGIIAYAVIIWSYVRCFSKKFDKRRRELDKYWCIRNRLRSKFAFFKKKHAERKTHRYFKCKMCKTTMRVPRGKGKIEITCPKCKSKIIKRT